MSDFVATAPPWDAPVIETVSALQDAGRDLFVAGFSEDHRYVLIVDIDNDRTTVAHVDTTFGLGRWESTLAHYRANTDVIHQRFPRR